jgi:hypothetical protein
VPAAVLKAITASMIVVGSRKWRSSSTVSGSTTVVTVRDLGRVTQWPAGTSPSLARMSSAKSATGVITVSGGSTKRSSIVKAACSQMV